MQKKRQEQFAWAPPARLVGRVQGPARGAAMQAGKAAVRRRVCFHSRMLCWRVMYKVIAQQQELAHTCKSASAPAEHSTTQHSTLHLHTTQQHSQMSTERVNARAAAAAAGTDAPRRAWRGAGQQARMRTMQAACTAACRCAHASQHERARAAQQLCRRMLVSMGEASLNSRQTKRQHRHDKATDGCAYYTCSKQGAGATRYKHAPRDGAHSARVATHSLPGSKQRAVRRAAARLPAGVRVQCGQHVRATTAAGASGAAGRRAPLVCTMCVAQQLQLISLARQGLAPGVSHHTATA